MRDVFIYIRFRLLCPDFFHLNEEDFTTGQIIADGRIGEGVGLRKRSWGSGTPLLKLFVTLFDRLRNDLTF